MKTLASTLEPVALQRAWRARIRPLLVSLALGMIALVAATTVDAVTPAVSAGATHIVALKSDGTAWAWGNNGIGQLGNNGSSTVNVLVPVQVLGLTGVTAVSAGDYHTVALKSDGIVWSWGDNGYGQLGILDDRVASSSVPVQVFGLNGVTAVSACGTYTVALKSDGSVWAWGDNMFGETPRPGTTGSPIPVQVSGLVGVSAVSAGQQHAVVLKSDGTVWAWGDNAAGQLGNNSTTESSYAPVQASGLTGVVAVSAGGFHTVALKSDGSVWAWGNNSNGQLGNSSTVNSLVPVRVSALTGVTAVSAGFSYTVALKSDGTVWAWGNNGSGQLGNNTTANSLVPVQVFGLTSVSAVSAGGATAALKSDGSVWAWGNNSYGQLGNNTTTTSLVPVQVLGPDGQGFLNLGASDSSTPIRVAPVPTTLPSPSTVPGDITLIDVSRATPFCSDSVSPTVLATVQNEGELSTCSGAFDLSKPTIVITHGWNSTKCDSSPTPEECPTGEKAWGVPPWMKYMAMAINGSPYTSSDTRPNVLLWNWQAKARSSFSFLSCVNPELAALAFQCFVPYTEVEWSGASLASALEQLISSCERDVSHPARCQTSPEGLVPYSKRIHFIGHSLGTGVITWTAKTLARYQLNVDQLSFLDSAYLKAIPPGPSGGLKDLRYRQGVFVDNYRSLVGIVPPYQPWAYGLANVDIFLPQVNPPVQTAGTCSLSILGDIVEAHGYAYTWYTSSWDNFSCKEILLDNNNPLDIQQYGSAWSIARSGESQRAAAHPYYAGMIPSSKWYLAPFYDPFSANSGAIIGGLASLTGAVAGYFVDVVAPTILQTGGNWISYGISKAESAVQVGANAMQFAITKDVQGVRTAVDVVGSLGQTAAGGVTYSLTETQRLSVAATSVVVQEAQATVGATTTVAVKAINAFDTAASSTIAAVDKVGHAVWDATGSIVLSLNSDATMHLSELIPLDATVMRFGFEFLVADPGTVLEVFVDGLPVYKANGNPLVGKGMKLSEYVDVAKFAGRNVNIAFRLSNAVEGNHGTVRIDDLFFARIKPADAPYAFASAPGLVRLGSKALLDGSKSTDLAGGATKLTYAWAQVSGPGVPLEGAATPNGAITPNVIGVYQFSLRVGDDAATTAPAVVTIRVPALGDVNADGLIDMTDFGLVQAVLNTSADGPNDVMDVNGDGVIDNRDLTQIAALCGATCNRPPIANAGQPRTVNATSPAGANVVLDGSASSDPDGDALTYNWTGLFGTASGTKPTVTLPLGTHVITLTVADGRGGSATATVTIVVADATAPVVAYTGNAGTYTVDQTVNIACSATDVGSGVVSTTCKNFNGPAYSFALGTNTFSATATDAAGNVGTGSTTFTVKVTTASLITLTRRLVTKKLIAEELVVELQLADAAARAGKPALKAKLIAAYVAELRAITGKAITPDNAAILIRLANAL